MSTLASAAVRTASLTALAMIAFAANSVLGRLGLVEGGIGPGSFALIRLVSGAAILVVLVRPAKAVSNGSLGGGLALLAYAAAFSYAYLALPAGTGALILFAVVQVTMVGAGLRAGEQLSPLQWVGFVAALAGLTYLVSPGLSAPDPIGAALMALAGIGWGIYSLLGRGGGDPAARTAGNFLRATAMAALLFPLALTLFPEPRPALYGAGLAVLSGAITSGLGYVIWYAALPGLTATRAGIAQLSVPAIAAIGGVIFLAEPFTVRFALASLVILGGVALATLIPTRRDA